MNTPIDENNDNIVGITSKQIKEALQFSEKYKTYPQYFKIYSLMLGLASLENWIQQYYLPIHFDYKQYSFKNKNHLLLAPFISGLKLAQFKGCLLINDDLFSNFIEIPEVAVNSPIFSAHFYLVTEIIEEIFEQEEENDDENFEELIQVKILGFVRRDEIIHFKKQIRYSEGYYQVPISALDSDFSNLYTYAEYLKYEKIPLAIAEAEKSISVIESLTKKITQFLLEAKFTGDFIWEEIGLNPRETELLFTQERLLNQLASQLAESIKKKEEDLALVENIFTESQKKKQETLLPLKNPHENLKTNIINLYTWFTGRLDESARSLDFVLPRSLDQFLNGAILDINESLAKQYLESFVSEEHLDLSSAFTSHTSFTLNNLEFELTIAAWIPIEVENSYCITYVLQPKTETFFPQGLILQIKDEDEEISNEKMSSKEMYFYQTLETEVYTEITLSLTLENENYSLGFCFNQKQSDSAFLSAPLISISYPLNCA